MLRAVGLALDDTEHDPDVPAATLEAVNDPP